MRCWFTWEDTKARYKVVVGVGEYVEWVINVVGVEDVSYERRIIGGKTVPTTEKIHLQRLYS